MTPEAEFTAAMTAHFSARARFIRWLANRLRVALDTDGRLVMALMGELERERLAKREYRLAAEEYARFIGEMAKERGRI